MLIKLTKETMGNKIGKRRKEDAMTSSCRVDQDTDVGMVELCHNGGLLKKLLTVAI
jgi:hypothetical protein